MSKHKFTVFHRVDHNNVGDIASNPLQYFLRPDEYQVVDITKFGSTSYNSELPIILGGGGLLGNELFDQQLHSLATTSDLDQLLHIQNQTWKLKNQNNQQAYQQFQSTFKSHIDKYIQNLAVKSTPKYLWAAGHNTRIGKNERIEKPIYPDWLKQFDHVGVRDWESGYQWLPCASCMHPAFDRQYQIKNDVVFFEHKKQLIKKFSNDSMPRFINSGSNIDQTIELLGTANIILTNSYHGAYWGILLGKKVIVVDPWSTKFFHMKHVPYILEQKQDWKDIRDSVSVYKTALEECRAATLNFWNTIK